ncbi:hypothetical protein BGZ73_000531 [Actinomortierella ambigua]|nr:hypothetical protein BGZ73_000531 [Actinomortierella ambigua]
MATRHARTADKSTNDRHSRILKTLLQVPGNKYCVDCRKKDPRWASFNLGCFMCIRCSGVHRSMGTHISRVKSVDLDSWTPEQVENMIKWGNEKANRYWEARLPEGSIPNENTSGIDPWIRSKYEYKQFAAKGPLPDPSELGPIDEGLLMQLYGQADTSSRNQAHLSRSSQSSSESLSALAPPPSNPTRSSFPKRPTGSTGQTKVQGADLFSIGQNQTPQKQQEHDFFGLSSPTSSAPSSAKPAAPPASSASQDLFSLMPPSSSNNQPQQPQQQQTQAAATQPQSGNSDWKSSIMSLYGSQPATPNRTSNGFVQPMQPRQQPVQQNNVWGSSGADDFGDLQFASSTTTTASSFDAFNNFGTPQKQTQTSHFQSGNMGFGGMNNGGFQSSNQNSGIPQGGEFFNAIASAGRPNNSSFNNQNSNKNNK